MRSRWRLYILAAAAAIPARAAVDLNRTLALLREGERLTPAAAQELERKLAKKAGDLENRLRLLAHYAGPRGGEDLAAIRAARSAHALWLIENEPKAAVFNYATRVYALQPEGGPLADPAAFAAAKAAWEKQLTAHPGDADLKRNAATYL
jgi:hypothetical protein